MNPEDQPEVEVEIEEGNLGDIDSAEFENATGIHVITITYDDNNPEAPEVNLGGTSPWLAYSIFSAALDSLSMIRAPLTIKFNGRTLFSTDMFVEEDDDYEDDY